MLLSMDKAGGNRSDDDTSKASKITKQNLVSLYIRPEPSCKIPPFKKKHAQFVLSGQV